MVRIAFSPRAIDDLERLSDFLIGIDKNAALATLEMIADAIQILERHPLVSRLCEGHIRELLISRGNNGYIASYSFDERRNAVLINRIRHQKEAGEIY